MKFNLKNRPRVLRASKPKDTPFDTIDNFQNQVTETEIWFANFEKELREMLELWDKEDSETATWLWLWTKEILGEVEQT